MALKGWTCNSLGLLQWPLVAQHKLACQLARDPDEYSSRMQQTFALLNVDLREFARMHVRVHARLVANMNGIFPIQYFYSQNAVEFDGAGNTTKSLGFIFHASAHVHLML